MNTSRLFPALALALTLAALQMGVIAHPDHGSTAEEIALSDQAPIEVEVPEEVGDSVTLAVMKDRSRILLKLQKFSVRGENFRVVSTKKDGRVEEIVAPPVCTYRGSILGDRDSSVVGSITERGVFMQVTCGDGDCWEINPPAELGESHRMRTVSLREQHEDLLHAVEFTNSPELLFGTLALPREVTVKQAEIGFDIDYPTWSRSGSGGFNRSDAAAVAKMEEFVAVKLNSFVISNALVEHVVGTIEIRKSAADDPYDGMTDGYAILPHMRNVWNGTGGTGFPRPSTTHDLATGLIGRGIGVAGLGYVGTINETSRYTIGTTTSGSGVGFWFNGICKHEVAHNWGLGHGGCGDEKRPIGDDFTWSMCGGYHDRMRSDEASRVISERDSSNLVDIGAYTASGQAPYCPKDEFEASISGGEMRLDVQRNDYDANNDPFQLESFQAVGGSATNTSELGGALAISEGSGPGGRDEVLYTPPASATPGAVDRFWYIVRDSTGRSNFGQVKVTLGPDIRPKEVNPRTFISDTAIDFDREDNPTLEQIGVDDDGNDVFREVWSYGSYDPGTSDFRLATGMQSDSPELVGDENDGWIGTGAVRVHKLAMQPGIGGQDAVKRWRSIHDGDVAIIYDAMRLQDDGDGQRALIVYNGVEVFGETLSNSNRHRAGTIFLTVAVGDTIDFVVDGLGSRDGDWTHFTGRIVRADRAKYREGGRPELHYRMDAASTFPAERRRVVADYSGNDYHAPLVNMDDRDSRVSAEIENGLLFDGSDDQITAPQPSQLQRTREMTVSAWIKAESLGANRGIITSQNDEDENLSYFGLLIGADEHGNPAQFRAHRNAINAPDPLPVGEWVHLVGTWESGRVQKLYLNGIEVADDPSPPAILIDTDRWIIGRDRAQVNRYFDGSIDDLALWDRVLDETEIRAIYLNGRDSREFDGIEDFIQIDSPVHANGSEEITMAAWVRADSLGENRGIITSYNGPDFEGDPFERSYFALLVGSNADGRPAQFRAHRYLVNALPGSFPIGEWMHIAGVWKAGVEQSLYVDGVKVAGDDDPVDKPIDIDAWIIGRDRLIDGRFFDGDIGETMILPRAMAADEIRELFEAGRTNSAATDGFFEFSGQVGAESGEVEEASGVYTTVTSGDSTDSFFFASREHTGDGEITVKLESLDHPFGRGMSGIMFREGREVGGSYVGIFQQADGRISRLSRAPGIGGGYHMPRPLTFPLWLRLQRDGDRFWSWFSEDGEEWELFSGTRVPLAPSLEVGIAHVGASPSVLNTASFSQLELTSAETLGSDSDGDGLDDLWELVSFGDLAQTADGDLDGDGITHLFERYHGSDPTMPDRQPIEVSFAMFTGDLINYGAFWRYLDNGSSGGFWHLPSHDDSSWKVGAAPLGYGEDEIATEVSFGSDSNNKHVTTFFRHYFFVHDPGLLSAPSLSVLRDDAVAVFLNGVELGRDNLAADADHETLADSQLGPPIEGQPVSIPIDAADLDPGWNVLAAEIHQGSVRSSDMIFDLELVADLDPGVAQGQFLTAQFERSKEIGDSLVATVESSSDLVHWTETGTPTRVIADNGSNETVEVIDDQPLTAGERRYLRIRLTVP